MKARKGSALLIVLGMLAFMVVSAVAFAAYMRYARLPSSYLRRTSASRLLAKAALARAIDEIDKAVCSNFHPGLGDTYVEKASTAASDWQEKSGNSTRAANIWKNRVFIGTNITSLASRKFAETTPVLNAEALAYIPPPLINSARYYGRLSPAAEWHTMDFDSGRYAFCALDVSDYFDINRIYANLPRASASNQRVSIGHIFDNATHTSANASDASAWDTWRANYDPAEDKVPLVSFADFNLAYKKDNNGAIGSLKSPFCDFLKGDVALLDSPNVQQEEFYRRMTFVTDGLFAPPVPDSDGRFDELWDLSDEANQPFTLRDLEQANPSLENVMLRYTSDAITRLVGDPGSICRYGLAALWDYLDPDHLPISLSVPTVERVPMVCGLETDLGSCKVKIERQVTNENKDLAALQATKTVVYSLSSQSFAEIRSGRIKTLVAYPFAHKDVQGDPKKNSPFKLDGRFGMFFTSEDMKLRTSGGAVLNFGKFKDLSQSTVDSDGVLMMPFLKDAQLQFGSSDITTEEGALDEQTGNFAGITTALNQFSSRPLLTVNYKWALVFDSSLGLPASDPTAYKSADGLDEEDDTHIDTATCGMPPLKADGTVDSSSVTAAQFKSGGGPTVKLNAAVWLRVKDKDGKTVDMAPACIKDDDDLNGMQNFRGAIGTVSQNTLGDKAYPLLRLDTGVELELKPSKLKEMAENQEELAATASPSSIMCADPRFNHAPECWFSMNGTLSKQTWLSECEASNRDGDIFMATSDSGYLQSIYELGNLLRLTNLASHGADGFRGDLLAWSDGREKIGTGFNSARNNGFMWYTYRPFKVNNLARDPFEDCGFTSAGTGYKVNPYSDSTNVIMAAFANTPLDWRVSGTNEYSIGYDAEASTFNRKYAWSYLSSAENEFKFADLQSIAASLMSAVRGSQSSQAESRDTVSLYNNAQYWEDAFDGLDWAGSDEGNFCGVNLSGAPLWISDKKFLYGFWKDCFAARQQVFLIFVRAEPSMMGGELAGATPPQLGSRAVALVWRDPDSGASPYPHQTRVLFYKPLD